MPAKVYTGVCTMCVCACACVSSRVLCILYSCVLCIANNRVSASEALAVAHEITLSLFVQKSPGKRRLHIDDAKDVHRIAQSLIDNHLR